MKLSDTLKITLNEYRYERLEWIISVFLQCLIYTCLFFLLTIIFNLDNVFGDYLSPLYEDGYYFFTEGYSESDISELEDMGFYDITFSSDGGQGCVITDKLDGIWINKFKAVFEGKDIWNEDLDEILGILFFCQFMFAVICIVLFIVMSNNINNSIAMKLARRKKYIDMLEILGCPLAVIKRIYLMFFQLRNIAALVISSFAGLCCVHLLNKYIHLGMKISISFVYISAQGILIIVALGIIFELFSFAKQWRQMNEK